MLIQSDTRHFVYFSRSSGEMVGYSCQAINDCYMTLLYELVKKHYTEETVDNLAVVTTFLFQSAELNNALDQNILKCKEGNYSLKQFCKDTMKLYLCYTLCCCYAFFRVRVSNTVKRGRNLEC